MTTMLTSHASSTSATDQPLGTTATSTERRRFIKTKYIFQNRALPQPSNLTTNRSTSTSTVTHTVTTTAASRLNDEQRKSGQGEENACSGRPSPPESSDVAEEQQGESIRRQPPPCVRAVISAIKRERNVGESHARDRSTEKATEKQERRQRRRSTL